METDFAAAAKSLQSCPTLCDPIDSSPSGSTVPGILQARTLEWAAISFSNAWKWKVKSESEVAQLCPTLSDPMDCRLPGSSIHGIFQARVLVWGAIAFSRKLTLGFSIKKQKGLRESGSMENVYLLFLLFLWACRPGVVRFYDISRKKYISNFIGYYTMFKQVCMHTHAHRHTHTWTCQDFKAHLDHEILICSTHCVCYKYSHNSLIRLFIINKKSQRGRKKRASFISHKVRVNTKLKPVKVKEKRKKWQEKVMKRPSYWEQKSKGRHSYLLPTFSY